MSVFFVAAPGWFVDLFSPELASVPYAIDCLRIVALGFLFYAYGLVIVMAFNGAGDVRTPMILNLACFWALKIPLAWALAVPFGLPEQFARVPHVKRHPNGKAADYRSPNSVVQEAQS